MDIHVWLGFIEKKKKEIQGELMIEDNENTEK